MRHHRDKGPHHYEVELPSAGAQAFDTGWFDTYAEARKAATQTIEDYWGWPSDELIFAIGKGRTAGTVYILGEGSKTILGKIKRITD